MKISTLLSIMLVLELLVGCASREITSLTPAAGECVVTYKAKVIYKGADVTDKTVLFFNGEQFGIVNKSDQVKLISLPCKDNYISAVNYRIGGIKALIEHQFDRTETEFTAVEGKVTYLGDLTINWKWHDESVGAGEIIGGIFALMINRKGSVELEVIDNSKESQEYLEKRFNSAIELNHPNIDKRSESQQ